MIGLELCPFAGKHWDAGRVRLAVTAAASQEALLEAGGRFPEASRSDTH